MSFQLTLLEGSFDPWLAVEPDRGRREDVIRLLMALCDAEGRWDDARPIRGGELPVLAAMVLGAGIVVVWVIAERYSQLDVRYLYDITTGQRFGG